MAPTTLIGQKTTSSPAGRSKERQGEPLDVTKLYTGMDIAYLARGSLDSVANINKTKSYLRKAFEKQMNHEGLVSLLYGITGISMERMSDEEYNAIMEKRAKERTSSAE